MKTLFVPSLLILLFCFAVPLKPALGGLTSSESDILRKYDHDRHEKNVFGPQNISCTHCHNFTLKDGKAEVGAELAKSTFKRPVKQICHECHQGSLAQNRNAPKECYTCHSSLENMKQIKPASHAGLDWAHGHASQARANSGSCTTCHSNSQCVKCHARRNDVSLSNHTRNFKFYHSIEARAQPQKCDTCHTKDYCIRCHVGRGR
jgi:hypothetical protein